MLATHAPTNTAHERYKKQAGYVTLPSCIFARLEKKGSKNRARGHGDFFCDLRRVVRPITPAGGTLTNWTVATGAFIVLLLAWYWLFRWACWSLGKRGKSEEQCGRGGLRGGPEGRKSGSSYTRRQPAGKISAKRPAGGKDLGFCATGGCVQSVRFLGSRDDGRVDARLSLGPRPEDRGNSVRLICTRGCGPFPDDACACPCTAQLVDKSRCSLPSYGSDGPTAVRLSTC